MFGTSTFHLKDKKNNLKIARYSSHMRLIITKKKKQQQQQQQLMSRCKYVIDTTSTDLKSTFSTMILRCAYKPDPPYASTNNCSYCCIS